ncbi:MAG: gas vesicle protein GvpJ [Candidatus Thermoplasmatota archaeon]|nr:gas vesicle protein GvpJ [Candidatus Thermoplasmatota archaeon]
MKPTKDLECTLVDVLDRILDKGIILNADVIIHVAGVPLIGINLRAALAGIETMLDYGMMEAWDASIRSWYAKGYADKIVVPLQENEKIILKTYGSYYNDGGIYSAWQHGYLYLTNKRLFLFRKEPARMLFETELLKIRSLEISEKNYLGKSRENLCLLLENNKIAMLYSENIEELKTAINKQIEMLLAAIEQ